MFKLKVFSVELIFAISLISTLAVNFVNCSEQSFGSKINLNVVQNLTDFMNANPGIQLKPLIKKVSYDGPSSRLQNTYTIGKRIHGDRLLITDSASQKWEQPQHVTQEITYPKSGYAEVITFFEIIVYQSSNLGNAYIVSGGIGQRKIAVVIVAIQTHYWQYRASIFGY